MSALCDKKSRYRKYLLKYVITFKHSIEDGNKQDTKLLNKWVGEISTDIQKQKSTCVVHFSEIIVFQDFKLWEIFKSFNECETRANISQG